MGLGGFWRHFGHFFVVVVVSEKRIWEHIYTNVGQDLLLKAVAIEGA